MRKEEFFEVLGELDDDIVAGAKTAAAQDTAGKIKPRGWPKWAAAACLAVLLAAAIPYLSDSYGQKNGPSQDDQVRPLDIIEYDGAYYEAVDMTDTRVLDAYRLPHKITADMVGSPVGTGLDCSGRQTERMMYQYLPYADIAAGTAGLGPGRAQRAVYVVEAGGGYSFALFCNFIHHDPNAHEEAGELFAVYGVDGVEDIASITIGGKTVRDAAEIQKIFDSLYHSEAMGNDGFQDAMFKSLGEEEQQALSIQLADSAVPLGITTADGLAINHLRYYPTINILSWGVDYYRLNQPIR